MEREEGKYVWLRMKVEKPIGYFTNNTAWLSTYFPLAETVNF